MKSCMVNRRAVQTLGKLSPELESAIEAGYCSCLVQSDLQLGQQTVVGNCSATLLEARLNLICYSLIGTVCRAK